MSDNEEFSVTGLIAAIIFGIIAWQFFIVMKQFGPLEQLRNAGSLMRKIMNWILPKNYTEVVSFIKVMCLSYTIKTVISCRHAFVKKSTKHPEYIQLLFLGEIVAFAVLFGLPSIGGILLLAIVFGIPNLIGWSLLKSDV